jgi:hypothetical protein
MYAHTRDRQDCQLQPPLSIGYYTSIAPAEIGKHEEKMLGKAFVHPVSVRSISCPTSGDILRTTLEYFRLSGSSV